MVDYQRQLLDELMGRNRNLDPGTAVAEKSWRDPENCVFFLVSPMIIDFSPSKEKNPLTFPVIQL